MADSTGNLTEVQLPEGVGEWFEPHELLLLHVRAPLTNPGVLQRVRLLLSEEFHRRSLLLMRLGVFFLSLVGGCGGTGGSLNVTPAMYLADKTLAEVHNGDRISLEFPPQGGYVLFVGARVKNLQNESLVTLRARLRSAADDSIFAEEGRTVGF